MASLRPSALLIIGQAASKMFNGRFEEAEKALGQVLQNVSDADALANMICVCIALHKPYSSYLSALKSKYPRHIFVRNLEQKEEVFELAAYKYI